MSGGKQSSARCRCARRLASGLMGGLLIAPWSASDGLRAEELVAGPELPAAKAPVDSQAGVDEQSIVVASGALPEEEDTALVIGGAVGDATDADADLEALEPISKSSEYEPDLADPPLGDPSAPEPTLADDYDAVATDGSTPLEPAPPRTTNQPLTDDMSVDDEVASSEPQSTMVATIQAASFNGVTPGVTTRTEILRQWGQPSSQASRGRTITYESPNFPTITVSLRRDVVQMLHVELATAADAETLIEKLGLTNLRPAIEADANGSPIATHIPERGVTLGHRTTEFAAMASDILDKSTSDRVYEIMLSPIQAGPFLLRAETSPARAYAGRIADLETALRMEPHNGRAHYLLSQTKLATGAAVAAEILAREAVNLEPRNDEYRLQWARCLKYLARYDEAVQQTRTVLDSTAAPAVLRAAAMEQMALLAALGTLEVQKRTATLLEKTIEMAQPLAASDNPMEAAGGIQILIGAHLAMAEQLAEGDRPDNDKVVSQWISRASALAEQLVEGGAGDVSLRLQVAVGALAAGAKLDSVTNPQPWVVEAEEAVTALEPEMGDPLAKAEIEWQLGLAYYYAAQIAHRAGEAGKALEYAEFAEETLVPSSASRQELPDTDFMLGRMYFQIGAVHAVLRGDHAEACRWYNRAIEPLAMPTPLTALAAPGSHGDALVSMAVSYWETGDRARAYELTAAGAELVERAIAEGFLPKEALEVPKNNYLAMARALGKVKLATPALAEDDPPAYAQQQPQPQAPTNRASRGRTQQQMRTATRRNVPSGPVRRR